MRVHLMASLRYDVVHFYLAKEAQFFFFSLLPAAVLLSVKSGKGYQFLKLVVLLCKILVAVSYGY